MLKAGITGGIGTGKSLVAKIFSIFNIPVYNADQRAKHLVNHDPLLKQQIIDYFGKKAFTEENRFNTTWMAKNVFNDEDKLKTLNNLIHPRVYEDYKYWLQDKTKYPYTLKEAALIFEAGSQKQLDKIITVYSPGALKIARVQQRDPSRSKEEIQNIINKQIPEDKKTTMADEVIYNDEKHPVIQQVIAIDKKLRKESGTQTTTKK